jgi:SAM-dependent methyltransferase|tara:strand:- start:1089 stop:1823 length:735 start_codon:yes stop_codon:yes gene_type:complete
MNKNYKCIDGDKDKNSNLKSMKKYFKQKQEIDKELEKIISPLIKNKELKFLDAGCGIGHVLNLLNKISPNSEFYGIDEIQYLINEAKKISANNKNFHFKVQNIYKLSEKNFYDISINWKTISWLPYYEKLLKILFDVTKKHIFLSSLFYDGDIDFEIKVRDYKSDIGKSDNFIFYNVYSLPKFKRFVKSLGAKKIHVYNFDIRKDIPKTKNDRMGTYTITLKNGKKLQISGAIVMNWKIIQIDL